ncbi:hypothetical protein IAQ61_009903 [Plenodomus lingam]|uniref:Similar to carboxypeptidase A n=1 Tax=Leptosphaeria maculans (strain JN3 / isolate v23.1.3 / race Av1-4-5-6-7-8) TaxID=985895 RepID=E4ZSL1_LEPMJ|nr:similar to carboxypeptidase A [Plenodomus lingam JN3]KAH9862486.1 hypothetical protein IAQ61_009903 [Plenodomus lingam]CBX94391.1 similar to carboxypeptidase A [Plenodomus lingam JN3]
MKYSLAASLILQSTVVLGNLLPVHMKAPTAAHFLDVVRNDTYDFGCRPVAIPTDDGRFKLNALLTEQQILHLTKEFESDPEFTIHREEIVKRADAAPIGTGDRFQGGAVAPSGLGTKPAGSTISSLMNVNEINSAIRGLATAYGANTLALPNRSFQGQTSTLIYVGAGTDKSKYHLYFSAGMHARERGGPDQILYFIADLLAANKANTGLTYGRKTYTNAQVKSVLAAGIVVFPLVNPDGVAYDQSSNSFWRKNRNTRSGSSGTSIGVDINRNFDFLWNFRRYFAPSEAPASSSPSSEAFYGTAPASEAETKNHVSVYSSFPKIRWFMDIHSAIGEILYNWGSDELQTTTPTMNFLNPAYDGRRGVLGDTAYREYLPATDANNIRSVASRTAAGMAAVGGRRYSSIQSAGLYATSGASDDYAASRVYAISGANKVHGFTMEFGYSTNFYPTLTEFNQNILDTCAGFFDWALAAISVGLE